MIVLVTLFLALGFFVLDLVAPIGLGEWGLYMLPLLLTLRVKKWWYPFVFAALCTILLLMGLHYSPPGGVETKWGITNRYVGTSVLWITAALLVQRKRAELALRESERQMRAILEYSPLPIFVKDRSGRYLEFSRQCEIVSGMSRKEALGKTDYEIFPKEVAAAVTAMDRDVWQAGRMVTREVKVPFKDGMHVHWSIKFPLLNEEGKCSAICGIVTDITEKKRADEAIRQSEERFRAISEQSLMGIYIVQDRKFTYVNPKMTEIYGYTPEEMLQLPSVIDLVIEEDRPKIEEIIQRTADDMKGVRYGLRVRRKDGGVITVEVHRFKTELNGKVAVIGTLQDVTQRVQEEEILQRTTEQLQTLSRRLLELQETERRHIARELHDEIGQALTALKINLQAVQRMANSTAFAPRLLDSISIVDRTLRQVRNLSLDLRPSMLDDLGLCSALRWYADQQAQRSGLRIQFTANPPEMRLETAVETACFRVAQEALTNIVRHAQAHSVWVELKVEGKTLHLTIRDDGVGFDLDLIRQQVANGTSLGVLGMEERASLMGGRIEMKSVSGEGSEVHGWFPVELAANQTEHLAELIEK
ncbi:MAG: Multi-sensor signal transduction histidine kinase [Pedosphaera sp.]|nr:Multi-sensor signal transduction histidine kinase [Pedosphaera sp.]